MRYYYANIKPDEHGNQVCFGIINTFAEMGREDHIRIEKDKYEEALIGKIWTGSEWIENPSVPEEPGEIVEEVPEHFQGILEEYQSNPELREFIKSHEEAEIGR